MKFCHALLPTHYCWCTIADAISRAVNDAIHRAVNDAIHSIPIQSIQQLIRWVEIIKCCVNCLVFHMPIMFNTVLFTFIELTSDCQHARYVLPLVFYFYKHSDNRSIYCTGNIVFFADRLPFRENAVNWPNIGWTFIIFTYIWIKFPPAKYIHTYTVRTLAVR